MLSLFFKIKKETTLEDLVFEMQKGNVELRNETIEKYKPFIAKTVSSVCKRFIDERDDEFSVGLIAFNEAIDKYSADKGSSLLAFAELIIKRKVIDYIRKEARMSRTLQWDPVTDEEEEGPQSKIEADLSIEEHQKLLEQEHRKEEILYYRQVLSDFGLSFDELIEQSPKHMDARQNAMKVAKTLIEDKTLKEVFFQKKRLPIKQLEKRVEVSRKTIERNRKYIMAMAIILSGDYVYLRDYIKGVLQS